MCGIAGILMLARFNSVRVGHGEAYLLITVLAFNLVGDGLQDALNPRTAK